MELLATEVRRLVYTVICFRCLLQITEGSDYQKYLKFFSYLLTLCICCNVIFSLAGQSGECMGVTDQRYEEWEDEWRKMMDENQISEGERYYEEELWGDKIMGEVYDNQNGGEEEHGELLEEASTDLWR